MKKTVFFCVMIFITYSSIVFSLDSKISYFNSQPAIHLEDLLQIRKDIKYIQLSDDFLFSCRGNYELSQDRMWWEHDPVVIPKRFVISIPNGCAHSRRGSVIVNNMYIDELIWAPTKAGRIFPPVDISDLPDPDKIDSKVAVLAQAGCSNYYHWMVELLPRLAILQQSGIDYDYLYVQLNHQFMKDSLELLGIDLESVIKPGGKHKYIQANELIVPSMTSAFGYTPGFAVDFLRKSFIPLAQKSISKERFSKKVFISRQNSVQRKIINEDEVFALFQKIGFVRYNLEKMSLLEQVMLFHNAESIVGEHGAGLTNIVFAQPGTRVGEIFQARYDAMYWYLSQELKLKYSCIKTMEFTEDNGYISCVEVPLDQIKNLISRLFM